MPTRFRPATMNDLEDIVAVFLLCWRESYPAVLPQRLVDAMTDQEASDLWTRVLRESQPGDVIVAESAQAPPATVLGVARIAVGTAGQGSVHSLYVSPRAQGMGVGSQLLSTACDALSASRVEAAGLWVFQDNAPSIAFYRHHGWLPDGQTRVQEAFGEPEIRLSKTLRSHHSYGNDAMNWSEAQS